MTTVKILAFAGSTRTGSYNKKLVQVATNGARSAGAEVTYLDLRDLPLPIYDQDLEDRDGLPAHAITLKDLMLAHHGLLIASPENNSSFSAVLKNAIDWASRPRTGEVNLGCFIDKVAAIMSASPGRLGGLRGLVHLRAMLENIYVTVIPDQVAIASAHEAFLANGTLKDPAWQKRTHALGEKLTKVLIKLNAQTPHP